jgi:hypothetical protein
MKKQLTFVIMILQTVAVARASKTGRTLDSLDSTGIISTTTNNNINNSVGTRAVSNRGFFGGLWCWLFRKSCQIKCCTDLQKGYDQYGNQYGKFKGSFIDYINTPEPSDAYIAITYYTSLGITSDYPEYECGYKIPLQPTKVELGLIEWDEVLDYGDCSPGSMSLRQLGSSTKKWGNSYKLGPDPSDVGYGNMTFTCLPCSAL